ncbi:MAG: hypothetical protein ACRD5J_12125 [Nitrososphaeraceae archaeon]
METPKRTNTTWIWSILNLDQHKSLKYVETTRIELDHVLDEAGPKRFFDNNN